MASARLLLVEDEPSVAESLFQSLDEVFDVCWVETAADACWVLDSGEMDVVLLDCTLRSGSAATVMSLAKKLGLPVVAMSGDADRGDPCRELGLRFLEKPFGLDLLIGTLGIALARNRAEQGREAASAGFVEPSLPVFSDLQLSS